MANMLIRLNVLGAIELESKRNSPVFVQFTDGRSIPNTFRRHLILGFSGWHFVEALVNDDPRIAEAYKLVDFPTAVVFVDGEEVDRMTGLGEFSRVKELLEKYGHA